MVNSLSLYIQPHDEGAPGLRPIFKKLKLSTMLCYYLLQGLPEEECTGNIHARLQETGFP
jgi:hypothetical protein